MQISSFVFVLNINQKKWNFILIIVNISCKFEQNLSLKKALGTIGLRNVELEKMRHVELLTLRNVELEEIRSVC
jgi:hypothetical protein